MFQIFECRAKWCPIYGGVLGGTHDVALPMTYRTKALAEKLAAIKTEEEYQVGGEDRWVVVPYGKTPTSYRWEREIEYRRELAAKGTPHEYDMPF